VVDVLPATTTDWASRATRLAGSAAPSAAVLTVPVVVLIAMRCATVFDARMPATNCCFGSVAGAADPVVAVVSRRDAPPSERDPQPAHWCEHHRRDEGTTQRHAWHASTKSPQDAPETRRRRPAIATCRVLSHKRSIVSTKAHTRMAGLNLRRLLTVGLTHERGTWMLA
jgi:hypothetical protein